MNKQELREYIRSQKRQYTSEELRVLSLSIMDRLMEHPRIQSAQTLLMYHSLPDEVDTHDALDQLLSKGKTVFLPVVVADGLMELQEYHGRHALRQGAFHIMEPLTSKTGTSSSQQEGNQRELPPIDTAVIPGIAFDSQGNRLGRGKGYYDRFLASLASRSSALVPYTIGLCFPFQKVEQIPTTPYDIPVDEVL